jgi:hypothetical protein
VIGIIAKKNCTKFFVGDGHVFMKILNNRYTPIYVLLLCFILTKQKYLAVHPLRWENASFLVIFSLILLVNTITLVNRAGQLLENVNFCDCTPKTIVVKRTRFVFRYSHSNNSTIIYYYYNTVIETREPSAHMQRNI